MAPRRTAHDSSSSSDDERLDQYANDRRLRQSISYLASEGGDDAPAVYVNRIQAIDDHVLQEYRNENYVYDHDLYQQLRSMVREVQGDLNRIQEEDSDLIMTESDASESDSVEALYRVPDPPEESAADNPNPHEGAAHDNPDPPRDAHDENFDPADHRRRMRHDREQLHHRPSPNDPRYAGILINEIKHTKHYEYGRRKDTQPEYWFRNQATILPFGETFFLREWESLKTHFDLSESKRNRGPVTATVPYELVSERFHPCPVGMHSGSRFTLPTLCAGTMATARAQLDLNAVSRAFNSLGDVQGTADGTADGAAGAKPDYAPRISLFKMSTGEPKGKGRAV